MHQIPCIRQQYFPNTYNTVSNITCITATAQNAHRAVISSTCESVREDDRHLLDGLLAAQGTSTLSIYGLFLLELLV